MTVICRYNTTKAVTKTVCCSRLYSMLQRVFANVRIAARPSLKMLPSMLSKHNGQERALGKEVSRVKKKDPDMFICPTAPRI